MEEIIKKQTNDLSTYQKRIELLIGARFKETDKMISAANFQDALRKKIGSWQGAKEIRKWRMRAN